MYQKLFYSLTYYLLLNLPSLQNIFNVTTALSTFACRKMSFSNSCKDDSFWSLQNIFNVTTALSTFGGRKMSFSNSCKDDSFWSCGITELILNKCENRAGSALQ